MTIDSILVFTGAAVFIGAVLKFLSWGYWLNVALVMTLGVIILRLYGPNVFLTHVLYFSLPLFTFNIIFYSFTTRYSTNITPAKYRVHFKLYDGKTEVKNVRRGVAVIGAAGSGKTESVVYNFLSHFRKHSFCGIIHDYKNFELTEIAYPLFRTGAIPFYIISFDQVYHKVNPIAPRYLPDEESVNEISRVLLENLLEQKDLIPSGTTKFFNDAAEGLISGLIWKLKEDYPQYCTLPHLIAVYQFLDGDSLVAFLSSNTTSKAMADAYISGIESERQTAAIKSTLANAFKKISTRRIFMTLSEDQVPLDINNPQSPAVVSVVNNPKFETAYSPAIAAILHTIIKQMSSRKRASSFILLEEAPTIRLLHMHRVPATLRSYDIATIYVMQDKIQNELLYGEKASRAILANLSYQFFGKVNDPDTAKYYERFFSIVKKESISINEGEGLDFDTRITRSEKETSKIRADLFFKLQPGEFVTFADGIEKRVVFRQQKIETSLPSGIVAYTPEDLQIKFEKIHKEAQSIFLENPVYRD